MDDLHCGLKRKYSTHEKPHNVVEAVHTKRGCMQEEDHTHSAAQLLVLMAFAYEVMIRYDVLSSHMR